MKIYFLKCSNQILSLQNIKDKVRISRSVLIISTSDKYQKKIYIYILQNQFLLFKTKKISEIMLQVASFNI